MPWPASTSSASPLSSNCSASGSGIMRAMRWVPPAPGNSPTLISGNPTRVFALSAATRWWLARQSSKPPPSAVPLIAATHGLPQVSSRRQSTDQPAALVEQQHRGRLLAARLRGFGELPPERLQHGEIGAGAERLLARGDDRALDGGVGRDVLDDGGQFLGGLRVDHVHRPAGRIPGDERDAVGVDIELEIDVGHETLRLCWN